MSASIEKIEKNKVKLTFSASPEKFEEGIRYSYNKNKNSIVIPGFRKGRVPRQIIEMNYGKDFFYPDAIEHIFPDVYFEAVKELSVKTVAQPKADILSASKEEGVVFTAEVFVKPEVKVEKYKGLEYQKSDETVTEEDLQKELDIDREKNARMVTVSDRPAALNDITLIDFTGYIDEIPFEGGDAKDFELTLGSKAFIDNFEDQIIGHNIGDEFDVFVRFPDEYGQPSLSGKEARFLVKLNDIKTKILPEIDDDFAQDVSEFDTLAEYKEDKKTKLAQDKLEQANRENEDKIMLKLLEYFEADIPEVMITHQIEDQLMTLKRNLRFQRMSYEDYLDYTGFTETQVRESLRERAEQQVKLSLALEEVADQENIEPTDEEIEEVKNDMVETHNIAPEILAEILNGGELENIKHDLRIKKAAKLIINEAVAI